MSCYEKYYNERNKEAKLVGGGLSSIIIFLNDGLGLNM